MEMHKYNMLEEELKSGIYQWYPFERDAKIFISNGNETPKEEYDYIILLSNIEKAKRPIELIRDCYSKLNKNGHLFLAMENRLGLRFFCGDRDPYTDRIYDGITHYNLYPEREKKYYEGRLYDRNEMIEMLKKAGVSSFRGYSVLPGLEMPQLIYAWDYMPQESLDVRFTPIYHHPSTVFLKEVSLYEGIINNGMFHQMANAYLIDVSKSNEYYEIDMVTISMDRGHEKATATILRKDNLVEKKTIFSEGLSTINNLISNTEELLKKDIKVVSLERKESGNGVIMPYIYADTALVYLRKLFFRDREKFIEEVDRFISCIMKSSEKSDTDNNDELGPIYKKVFLDMVPLNAFYINGEYVFFDQEFVIEEYPINVVVKRTIDILYDKQIRMSEVLPPGFFEERYGIQEKAGILFHMGDQYIQNIRNASLLRDFNIQNRVDYSVVSKNLQRMDYSAEEYQKLFYNILDDIGEKKVYIFGSGLWAKKFIAEYGDRYPIVGAFDNNQDVWGQQVNGIDIISPELLCSLQKESYKLIICVKRCKPILKMVKELGVKFYALYDPNIENQTSMSVPRNNNVCTTANIKMDTKDADNVQNMESKKKYEVGYVAGVFDLFHVGHLNILKRAKEHCRYLIVGVVSDEQATKGKAHSPYVNEEERRAIVEACKYVDEVFIIPVVSPTSRDVYKKYHFDVQFSGSDYENDPYWLQEQAWLRERGSDIVFFPYTQSTSSTKLKQAIEKN